MLDWRGIVTYVLLAYLPTWAVHIGMIYAGVRFDNMPAWAIAVVAGTMFFPALSAFIVRKWVTREGFATAGLRFGHWRPYVAIWLGTPVLFGAVYGLSYLLGFAGFDPTAESIRTLLQTLAPDQPVPPASVLLLATFISTMTLAPLITGLATFGEEFGWTGFLLPKLMPLGKWRATLVYGFIWGIWHAPIIWGGYNYPGYPVLGIFLMCVFCTSAGLIMAALRLRTGSVLTTTWFHAMINTQGRGIWSLILVGVHPLLGGMLGVTGLATMGAIGAWLLHNSPDHETLPAVKAA